MKRILAIFLLILCITGCAKSNANVDSAMEFRQKLLSSGGCGFQAQIFADYGDIVYTFTLDCTSDNPGNLRFKVIEPESIQGITGEVSASGGKLTFDGTVLSFPPLADEQITPVCAPWVMIRGIRSGYIQGVEHIEDGFHMLIDDSYQEDPLTLDVYFDNAHIPTASEILWRGKRILSMKITRFHIL